MPKQKSDIKWRKALGGRLRRCRDELGLTQLRLSELLDVSREAVGLWETGAAIPSDQHKMALANLFGKSVDWLLVSKRRVAEGQAGYDVGAIRAAVAGEIKKMLESAEEDLPIAELRRIRDHVRFMVQQARQARQSEGDETRLNP